jgi:hypothetical protein
LRVFLSFFFALFYLSVLPRPSAFLLTYFAGFILFQIFQTHSPTCLPFTYRCIQTFSLCIRSPFLMYSFSLQATDIVFVTEANATNGEGAPVSMDQICHGDKLIIAIGAEPVLAIQGCRRIPNMIGGDGNDNDDEPGMVQWSKDMCLYLKPHKAEVKSLTEFAKKQGKTYNQVFGEIRGKPPNRRKVVEVIQALKTFNASMNDKEKRGKNYVHMQHTLLEECEAIEPGWAAQLDAEGTNVGIAIERAREKLGRKKDQSRSEKIKVGMAQRKKQKTTSNGMEGEDGEGGEPASLLDSYQLALTMANAYSYFLQNPNAASQLLPGAQPFAQPQLALNAPAPVAGVDDGSDHHQQQAAPDNNAAAAAAASAAAAAAAAAQGGQHQQQQYHQQQQLQQHQQQHQQQQQQQQQQQHQQQQQQQLQQQQQQQQQQQGAPDNNAAAAAASAAAAAAAAAGMVQNPAMAAAIAARQAAM